MGWKHYQTVDNPKMRAPGLKGTVWYPSTKIQNPSNLQYFILSSIYPIPAFEKKYLFPKMSKNHTKIHTKPPNCGYGYKHRDLPLLETWPRYWQKLKAVLRDVKTAFACAPALTWKQSLGRLLFRPKMITYTLTAIKSCSADQKLMLSNGDQKPEK